MFHTKQHTVTFIESKIYNLESHLRFILLQLSLNVIFNCQIHLRNFMTNNQLVHKIWSGQGFQTKGDDSITESVRVTLRIYYISSTDACAFQTS